MSRSQAQIVRLILKLTRETRRKLRLCIATTALQVRPAIDRGTVMRGRVW